MDSSLIYWNWNGFSEFPVKKNYFRTSELRIACDTTFLGKLVMSNPFVGVFLQFEVNITVKGHVQGHVSEIMQQKTVVVHVINIVM